MKPVGKLSVKFCEQRECGLYIIKLGLNGRVKLLAYIRIFLKPSLNRIIIVRISSADFGIVGGRKACCEQFTKVGIVFDFE